MKKLFLVFLSYLLFVNIYAIDKQTVRIVVADVSGAYSGFQFGTAGGPMGQSLGIVLGGIISSSYEYIMAFPNSGNNNTIFNPDKEIMLEKLNEFEKSGFYHNEGVTYVLNNLKVENVDETSNLDLTYKFSVKYTAMKFNIAEDEIYTQFPISKFSVPFSKNSDEYKASSSLILDYIDGIYNLSDSQNFIDYTNEYLFKLEKMKEIDEVELIRLKHSLNVAKSSYNLWSSNLKN
jgi:hypothetical protein